MPSLRGAALLALTALLTTPLAGCAEATGSAQIFVQPEDTVSEGLNPGSDVENIKDGWAVTYDRFLVAIGNVRASRSDSDETLSDPAVYVLDLRGAPPGGYVIKSFEDVPAARWDRFGFDLPNAKQGATSLPPTSDADLELMVSNGYSVYVEGNITKCPIGGACDPASEVTFRWGLAAGTAFDDCATEDGFTGFAVPEGGTAQVKPTIHGDHWFFNNITSGAELTERYAQYIADCDLDMNGETTLDELKQAKASDVLPSEKYNLSGALTGPVSTAFDYVLAQASTLGDFQGDGECPTRRVLP
jgi:hypothetical protein